MRVHWATETTVGPLDVASLNRLNSSFNDNSPGALATEPGAKNWSPEEFMAEMAED